jgi:hypothetical protein
LWGKFDTSFLQYFSNNIKGLFLPLIAVVGAPYIEQVVSVALAEVEVNLFAKISAHGYLLGSPA